MMSKQEDAMEMESVFIRSRLVQFAREIIYMDRQLTLQEKEIKRLQDIEKKYQGNLQTSIEHGDAMMRQVVDLVKNGGKFTPGMHGIPEDATGPFIAAKEKQ